MTSNKHKGLPKKIKEIVEEELQALRGVILTSVNEGKKMSKADADNLEKLVKPFKSIDGIIPHKDILFINYTKYSERAKIIKAVSKLYKYDNDGRSTNAPRGIMGLGGANWIAFVNEGVKDMNEGTDKKLDKLFQASKLADIRMGEDKLYNLAMAWENWNADNDDQYEELVDDLFAAVEMVQDDTSAGKGRATRILKQFQKDVVEAMKAHEDVPDEKDMSLINKARATAAIRQIKSGKRDDGMGKFTDRLFGLNSAGNWMQIDDPSDLGFYRKFGLAEAKLPDEGFSEPDQMREAKSAKSLKAEYEKAIKKEQALSSLMLLNLVKYKQAKASGNETAIAKFTKIAGQLSPKKKVASENANAAYQAYEDKISGLHADAELQIDEELKRVTKPMWDKMDGDARVNVVLSAVKDPDEAEQYFETEWEDLPSEVTQNIYLWEGKVNEANINWSTLHKDNQNYKYKKYVTQAFDKISDAMFEFRNAMGVKQLGQADPKLKKRIELMQAEIFALRRDMKSGGLTESKLNEMDINDPVLVAMRAFKTQLKKDKSTPPTKKISMNKYYKLMDMESDLIDQMQDAAKELKQLDSDMNAEAGQKGDGWSDDDANRYGGDLDKLQTKYEKLAKQKAKVKKAIMDYRIS